MIYVIIIVILKFVKAGDIKSGGTRGQIDDIIHNSSYHQTDSIFLTELGALKM